MRVNLALLHAASVPIFFTYRASILLHSCALCDCASLNVSQWDVPTGAKARPVTTETLTEPVNVTTSANNVPGTAGCIIVKHCYYYL